MSCVTGPWRAAFPENSHQDDLGIPTLHTMVPDRADVSVSSPLGRLAFAFQQAVR